MGTCFNEASCSVSSVWRLSLSWEAFRNRSISASKQVSAPNSTLMKLLHRVSATPLQHLCKQAPAHVIL